MMSPQRIKAICLVLVILLVGAISAGCDTVAEISFDERNFFNVFSLGPANPGACEADDTDVEMRFILRDQKGLVIRYNDRLEKVSAVNETTLTTNEITLQEGLLYSVSPQLLVRCEPDPSADPVTEPGKATGVDSCLSVGGDRCVAFDDGSENLGVAWDASGEVHFCRRSCTSDGECAGGSCATAPDGLQYCQFNVASDTCNSNTDCPSGFDCNTIGGNDTQKLCSTASTIQAKPGSVKYVSPKRNGSSEPAWAVAIVMDNSGSLNGRGVEEDDNSVVIPRATDSGGFRVAAMRNFLALLNDTEKRPWKEAMALSLWSFSGESSIGVKPLTGEINIDPPNPFVLNTAVVDNALTALRNDSKFGRSNVFVALDTVAENMAALPTSNRQKAIILFTDGPDDSVVINPDADSQQREAGLAQWNTNLDNAISALQNAEAQVFIIHLDTGIGPKGLKDVKPDPKNAKPYPRDGNGRTGPLAEYARIACATGGQYVYADAAVGLTKYLELLVDHFGGTWAVDVGIETLGRPSLELGPYKLGGVLGVNLGDDGRYFFSPLGNSSASIGTNDNRPPVFKRQNGTDRSNSNLGGSATNTTINLPMGMDMGQ